MLKIVWWNNEVWQKPQKQKKSVSGLTFPQHWTSILYSSLILGSKLEAAAPYVRHVSSYSRHVPVTSLLQNLEKLLHYPNTKWFSSPKQKHSVSKTEENPNGSWCVTAVSMSTLCDVCHFGHTQCWPASSLQSTRSDFAYKRINQQFRLDSRGPVWERAEIHNNQSLEQLNNAKLYNRIHPLMPETDKSNFTHWHQNAFLFIHQVW